MMKLKMHMQNVVTLIKSAFTHKKIIINTKRFQKHVHKIELTY